MGIVNAHVHLIEVERAVASAQKVPEGIASLGDLNEVLRLLAPQVLLEQMDEAGVSKSILYAVDAPLLTATNDFVAGLCSSHPDRFIGFASVDPKRGDGVEELERAVARLGLCGLKFHPPLQDFYPNDPVAFPLYEKAVELDIPVVFHVGSTPFGSLCRLDQANPLLIDELAVRFPTLRVLLTHLGTLWHNETFMVAEKNPNVFVDTAAYLYEIPQLLTRDLVARVGPEKFVFGTDYPMPSPGRQHRIADFVECIRHLDLSAEVRAGILERNFQALLGSRAALWA